MQLPAEARGRPERGGQMARTGKGGDELRAAI